jgi:hypothetical protein
LTASEVAHGAVDADYLSITRVRLVSVENAHSESDTRIPGPRRDKAALSSLLYASSDVVDLGQSGT